MFGIFPAAPDLGPDGRCSSPRLLREQFMKFAEALNGLGRSCRQWEILNAMEVLMHKSEENHGKYGMLKKQNYKWSFFAGKIIKLNRVSVRVSDR